MANADCTWKYPNGSQCSLSGSKPNGRCWRHERSVQEPPAPIKMPALQLADDVVELPVAVDLELLDAMALAELVGVETLTPNSAGAVFLQDVSLRYRVQMETKLREIGADIRPHHVVTRVLGEVLGERSKEIGRISSDLGGTPGDRREDFITEKGREVLESLYERDYAGRVAAIRKTGLDPAIDPSRLPRFADDEQRQAVQAWYDEYDAIDHLEAGAAQLVHNSPRRVRMEEEVDRRAELLEASASAILSRWGADPMSLPRPSLVEAYASVAA